MRLSRYFLPVLRENPSEAQIVSHRLMLRAGMIRQSSAGIYSWLPLGLRVLQQDRADRARGAGRAGAQEVLMPTIQPADLWRESGRYDDYGKEMLRISDRHEREMLYGPTNEELITEIFRDAIKSYRDLPKNLYHIQWKFRDEVRPRFGVMRGREFLMKDAYSFDLDAAGAKRSYNKMFVAYLRTFARMGLKAIPMRADTGPIGGDLSHEFIVLAETGESAVYCDKALARHRHPRRPRSTTTAISNRCSRQWTALYAATDEKHDPAKCPVPAGPAGRGARHRGRPDLLFRHQVFQADERGRSAGPDGEHRCRSRWAPTASACRAWSARIIEASHDDAGIIWPERVAPFQVGLDQSARRRRRTARAACDELYAQAARAPASRCSTTTATSRRAPSSPTMDLIGLPWQLIVGPRGARAPARSK